MTADKIVEELRVATGWPNIHLVNETIVVKMDITEMQSIKGLQKNSDNMYLEFSDFDDYSISFVVTAADTVHQYWTLGGRLHRTNDLPAYVSFDPTNDRIIRRWYWNGLKHRIAGPAQTMTKGMKAEDLPGFSGFYIESWDYMELAWFQEGFASRFPYCSEAKLERGQRIRNKETNITQSPRDDLPALVAEKALMSWDTFVKSDEFRPTSAEITELREIYNRKGEITSRDCSMCDFNWRIGDRQFSAEEYSHFNEQFKDELFSMIDLWGPFYKDSQTEVLVISEFSRVTDSYERMD